MRKFLHGPSLAVRQVWSHKGNGLALRSDAQDWGTSDSRNPEASLGADKVCKDDDEDCRWIHPRREEAGGPPFFSAPWVRNVTGSPVTLLHRREGDPVRLSPRSDAHGMLARGRVATWTIWLGTRSARGSGRESAAEPYQALPDAEVPGLDARLLTVSCGTRSAVGSPSGMRTMETPSRSASDRP